MFEFPRKIKKIASCEASQSELFLLEDGTVYSCGFNGQGQLGLGDTKNRSVPELINLSGVKDIVIATHSLFLMETGEVYGCGFNSNGQLGLGDTVDRHTPVKIPGLHGIIAIANSTCSSIFLRDDKTVGACGKNEYGRLGMGNTGANILKPSQIPGLSDVISIYTGSSNFMIVKSDGTVWGSGDNSYGSLGVGDSNPRYTLTKITSIDNIKKIVCGYSCTVFLKNDGTAWSCGYNGSGQCGVNSGYNAVQSPGKVANISQVIDIAAGSDHSIFLKSDGTVWGCGRTSDYQLGLSTTSDVLAPVQIPVVNNIIEIEAGAGCSLFLKNDNSLYGCGATPFGSLLTEGEVKTPTLLSGIRKMEYLVSAAVMNGILSMH